MAKMQVITDIKRVVVDVDERDPQYWLDIALELSGIQPDFSMSDKEAAYSIKRQLLKGRKFNKLTRTGDETWVIAHDNESAELLGIEFDAWNQMEKEKRDCLFALNNLRELSKLNDKEMDRIKNMNFIGRLMFLITGRANV